MESNQEKMLKHLGHLVLSLVVVASMAAFVACGDDTTTEDVDSGTTTEPLVTEASLADLVEVRDCRISFEHFGNRIRILVDSDNADYFNECVVEEGECTEPFPDGTLITKPHYDFNDADCTGEILRVTTARKEVGAGWSLSDWHWQDMDGDFQVVADGDPPECTGCHSSETSCEFPFDYMCYSAP